MARFNRLDNQAPVQSELESSTPKVGRSVFNYSHVHSGNALLGAVIPILNMEVVPNEDITINLSSLISLRNPLVRPLLNGMRVYFHGYCNYLVDLWEGAKNFLDTGRTGQINLTRPRLIYSQRTAIDDSAYNVNACTPLSLLNFLGLPVEVYGTKYGTSSFTQKDIPPLRSFQPLVYPDISSSSDEVKILSASPDYVPADMCVAYQRNWRDFYCNKNLLQNNKLWFPDNEDHFILSYSCSQAVAINYGYEDLKNVGTRFANICGSLSPAYLGDVTPETSNPQTSVKVVSVNDYRSPNLSGLKFRQFRGDRFTSALPFPDLIRGDIPLLDASHLNTTDGYSFTTADGKEVKLNFNGDGESVTAVSTASSGQSISPMSSSITMNDIRALETFTVFKERMARCSGDYNDMIEAQYGFNPHWRPREATYIGGFYTDFQFSTNVQQSQSTESSHLGEKSGDANATGSGSIGHIHTRDFGWIQVYMSIVPDVFYTQGIERQFSKKHQTDMYFPIFNNLAPQAILNKELYVSGDTATDNDVFAYEDRYAEFKSKINHVSGFMSLPHDVAEFDSARIMARRFSSTPSFNSQFLTLIPENIDMEVFTVQDEPPFDFQVGFDINRVFPGPYTSVPGSLSSNLHA